MRKQKRHTNASYSRSSKFDTEAQVRQIRIKVSARESSVYNCIAVLVKAFVESS